MFRQQGARLVRDFLGELYGLAVQSLDLASRLTTFICPDGRNRSARALRRSGAYELAVQFLVPLWESRRQPPARTGLTSRSHGARGSKTSPRRRARPRRAGDPGAISFLRAR